MQITRSGFTLTEVLMALGLSVFIAAIGFTGIQTFGKAVTRAKQFAGETQMITMCMQLTGYYADASSSYSFATTTPSILACPPSWPQPFISTSALSLKVDSTKADFIGKMGEGASKPYDVVYMEVLGRMP
jgi:prepilin-type N-terminal cleavage/methylation domain-containing protein